MRLLAIDTSTDHLSLAVIDGGKVVSRIHKNAPRSHSSLLLPAIDRILKRSKTTLDGLDGFCLSVGPGSFTGLRIGVATVKGLAVITGKPVAAVPTLDVIAGNAKRFCGIICAVLDARKGKVYARVYSSDGKNMKGLSGILLVPAEELMVKLKDFDKVLFIGDYAEKASSLLERSAVAPVKWQPKPETVGSIGAECFRKKRFVDAEDLEPLYVYSRECDITGK